MKKISLLLIIQMILFACIAQKHESRNVQRPDLVNLLQNKLEYLGYTIQLLPAQPASGSAGSYGFDILKDNKPVVHQFQNPMPFSPSGVQKKEDAYKIAQWIILQYNKTGHWQNIIPPHIARELKVETNSSLQNN